MDPASVRPFTFSKIFFSETAWPIKAKFYVDPPWEGGTKVYINGPGHMTKMAATPIYDKKPSKIFSRTGGTGGRTGLVVRASDSGLGDPGLILGRVGVLFP